ncbi:MAG TPA: hypothetical protein VK983_03360 [Candidatus Limnocylindrales bacterium]|nr:hypothetical protein [Candidatus Limnocylindrales bacterium]
MNYYDGCIHFSEAEVQAARYTIGRRVPLTSAPDVYGALLDASMATQRSYERYGQHDLGGNHQRTQRHIEQLADRIAPLALAQMFEEPTDAHVPDSMPSWADGTPDWL